MIDAHTYETQPSHAKIAYTVNDMLTLYKEYLTLDEKTSSNLEKYKLRSENNYSKLIEEMVVQSKQTAELRKKTSPNVGDEQRVAVQLRGVDQSSRMEKCFSTKQSEPFACKGQQGNRPKLAKPWHPVETMRNATEILKLKSFDASVTFAQSSYSFYIVPEELKMKYGKSVDSLMERDCRLYNACSINPRCLGSFYVLKNGLYDFSRVFCTERELKTTLVNVFNVDTGQHCTVRLNNLTPMNEKLMDVPMLAVHCNMTAVRDALQSGQIKQVPLKVDIEFVKRVSKQLVKVVVSKCSIVDSIVPNLTMYSLDVDIYDKENGESLSNWLIEESLKA